MAEDNANTGAQVNPPAGAASSTDSGSIPKARFDEVNTRMKAAEATLAELRKASEERERNDLEARGQYEKLKGQYEEQISALRLKADQWDSYHTTRRETLLAGLSDEDKPLADGLALEKLEALVSRLTRQADAPPAPAAAPAPAARPGNANATGKLTPAEIQEGVRKHGPQFIRDNFARL